MSKNKIYELPLSIVDEEVLRFYNHALEVCRKNGFADFDFSKLNQRIILRANKINFKVYNDVSNNKIVRMS